MSDGKMGRAAGKHSPYGEPLTYRGVTSSDDRGVQVDTAAGNEALFVDDTDSLEEALLERAVACVNACAGMEDPAKEIARLRRIEKACPTVLSVLLWMSEAIHPAGDRMSAEMHEMRIKACRTLARARAND